MAKFEEHLRSTSLTFDDLNESTKTKIGRFDDLYTAYSNAYDAEDFDTSDKYEKQLEKLDGEILEAIKKQDTPTVVPPKVERTPKEEATPAPAVEPTPTPQAEVPKATEEPTPTPAVEEPKKEEPKKGSGTFIGMFEI